MSAFDLLYTLLQPMTWIGLIAFGVWMRRDHVEARRQYDELKERLERITELVEDRKTPTPSPARSEEANEVVSAFVDEPQLPAAIARYRS